MSVQLPFDIIYNIVEALIPFPNPTDPIALPATDPLTKTLLSLTRTSKATNSIATKYLYRYCVYIDSIRKLYALRRTLSSPSSPHYKYPITSLYLFIRSRRWIRDMVLTDTTISGHRYNITAITTILTYLAPTLTRFVSEVEILPERRANVVLETEDEVLRAALLAAFQSLTSLEVFASLIFNFSPLNGDLALLSFFPKLRVLGSFSPNDLDPPMWSNLIASKSLETVILVFAGEEHFDMIKEAWKTDAEKGRRLNLVHAKDNFEADELERDTWRTEENNLRVRKRACSDYSYLEHDNIVRNDSGKWVKSQLLRGEDCTR